MGKNNRKLMKNDEKQVNGKHEDHCDDHHGWKSTKSPLWN